MLHVLLLLRCGVSGAASGLYIYFAHLPQQGLFRFIISLNSTGRRTAHSPPRIYVLSMLRHTVLFGRACDLVLRIIFVAVHLDLDLGVVL